jgi:hypothetical protein
VGCEARREWLNIAAPAPTEDEGWKPPWGGQRGGLEGEGMQAMVGDKQHERGYEKEHRHKIVVSRNVEDTEINIRSNKEQGNRVNREPSDDEGLSVLLFVVLMWESKGEGEHLLPRKECPISPVHDEVGTIVMTKLSSMYREAPIGR